MTRPSSSLIYTLLVYNFNLVNKNASDVVIYTVSSCLKSCKLQDLQVQISEGLYVVLISIVSVVDGSI